MFAGAASLGAVFFAVLAIAAVVGQSALLTRFLTESPLVTAAAALGVGVMIEFVGGAIYDWLHELRNVTPGVSVRRLPEYAAFSRELKFWVAAGRRVGLSKDRVLNLVAEYQLRSTGPPGLVAHLDRMEDQERMHALVIVSAALAAWTAVLSNANFNAAYIAVGIFIYAWLIHDSRRYRRRQIDAMREHFLRSLAEDSPVLSWHGRPLKGRGATSWLRLRYLRLMRRIVLARRRKEGP